MKFFSVINKPKAEIKTFKSIVYMLWISKIDMSIWKILIDKVYKGFLLNNLLNSSLNKILDNSINKIKDRKQKMWLEHITRVKLIRKNNIKRFPLLQQDITFEKDRNLYKSNIINLYHVTHKEVNNVKLTEGLIILANDLGLKHDLYKYYQYHVRNITAYKYDYPDLVTIIFPGKHGITSLVEEELNMFNTFINIHLKKYAKYVEYDPTNGLIIYSCIVYKNKGSVWLTDNLIREIQTKVRFFRLTYPHDLNKLERYSLRQKSIIYYENIYLLNNKYFPYIEKLKYFLDCDIIFLMQKNDDSNKIIINAYFDVIKSIYQVLLININRTLENLNMTLEDFDILFNIDHTNGLIFFIYFASQAIKKESYEELLNRSNLLLKKIIVSNKIVLLDTKEMLSTNTENSYSSNEVLIDSKEQNLKVISELLDKKKKKNYLSLVFINKELIDVYNKIINSNKQIIDNNILNNNLKNNKKLILYNIELNTKINELKLINEKCQAQNIVSKDDNQSIKTAYQIEIDINKIDNYFLKYLFEEIKEILNLITFSTVNTLLTITLLYKRVTSLLKETLEEKDLEVTLIETIKISLRNFQHDISSYAQNINTKDITAHTVFLLNISYDFINWKYSLITKIHEKEMLNKRNDQLKKIKDIGYITLISKNQTKNVSLISILFNNAHKKDFINLTDEEEYHYLTFLKNYLTPNNLLETKILLDPTKGLITLYYYIGLEEYTLENKYKILTKILLKFKTYLYQMLKNPKIIFNNIKFYKHGIITLLESLTENNLPRKLVIPDYDSLENLDYNFEDVDELLSLKKKQSTFREKIGDNPKLNLLKQQSNIFYLSENNVLLNLDLYINEFTIYKDIIMFSKEDFLYNLIEKENVSTYFINYIFYLGQEIFDKSKNTNLSHFMNYLYIYNNYNDYTVNLISLLFANLNLVSIEDLSYTQKKLLLIFLHEILLPDKYIYEALALKLLLDKSGGMALIQYYIYHKSPKQSLNSKELYDIKKTIIKFQFDNDIEIIHDFIDKTSKLQKYADNLPEKKFDDYIFIEKNVKKPLFINLIL